jgi:pilus assembly protein CpaB
VTQAPTRVLVGLAAVLGLAAAAIGYFALNAMANRAAAGTSRGFRDVVVTATDLTFGVKLEATMLRVARYPKESVPAGAYSTVDSVVGQTTKVFLGAREPITTTKLSSRGGGLSMLVRPNMRAASIEVNQVSGVSGFVLPGDRVDVLTTVDPRNAGDNAITRTLLQNIEVLAAGQKTQQQDNRPISVQSVTLLVDPEGAEMLAHAQHEGEIHLVLRNPEDQETAPVDAFSTQQMLGVVRAAAAPRRTVYRAPRPAATPSVPEPPQKVRIIRNASITETPAVNDSVAP